MIRSEPTWYQPLELEKPSLYLYNSLTRQKEIFMPKKDIVTWYSCGPTTYDESHMGHARSYISFDILRRILQDYFGYPLLFVMNITDIDDKIIKRARTKYLFEQYKQSAPQESQLMDDLTAAFVFLEKILAAITDLDKRKMLVEDVNKTKMALDHFRSTKVSKDKTVLREAQNRLIEVSEPVLGEWLDSIKGSQISDNSIFATLPRHYEDEFIKDMEELNVLPPDVMTRVSEFVPQIISFVQRILDNGFAYESNGSVYFDVAKFDEQPNHYYAKLVPEAYGNQGALEEGEGVLSTDRFSDKKNANDFALWKASKPGEPWWDSPWGKGRPGWHIECSAMAGEILGENLDIHTGGVDLKFPHHDNEIAQSEAYFGCPQWVNYFLHTGHLHIDGCKMSKSLKNFITIKKALEEHSTAQLRLAFLLHSWKDTLDYSANTMEGAKQYFKMLTEFGLNIDDVIRRLGVCVTAWSDAEKKLNACYDDTRLLVHKSLCDNIDTRSALDAIRNLVTETNKYVNSVCKVNSQLITNIKNYVLRMFRIFGVVLREPEDKGQNEEKVLALAGVVAEVREKLRSLAKEKHSEVSSIQRQQLDLCDHIRDNLLPPLGVRLEDRDQGKAANKKTQRGPSSIKLVNPDELRKELEERRLHEATKKAEKEKKKAEAAAKNVAFAQERMKDPQTMFRTGEYSAWDQNGLPTHDQDGKEVTKSQLKKLAKLMEAQKKKFQKWEAQQSS